MLRPAVRLRGAVGVFEVTSREIGVESCVSWGWRRSVIVDDGGDDGVVQWCRSVLVRGQAREGSVDRPLTFGLGGLACFDPSREGRPAAPKASVRTAPAALPIALASPEASRRATRLRVEEAAVVVGCEATEASAELHGVGSVTVELTAVEVTHQGHPKGDLRDVPRDTLKTKIPHNLGCFVGVARPIAVAEAARGRSRSSRSPAIVFRRPPRRGPRELVAVLLDVLDVGFQVPLGDRALERMAVAAASEAVQVAVLGMPGG